MPSDDIIDVDIQPTIDILTALKGRVPQMINNGEDINQNVRKTLETFKGEGSESFNRLMTNFSSSYEEHSQHLKGITTKIDKAIEELKALDRQIAAKMSR
ncbi:WXG100 family type VII secretion target [Nocardia yamanashiensis]|uniref:WXG100 family type VII secretion target n=1 Tax=Nocardia yamanashiensis TaxID=209247 RepID=UPI0008307188|nr:hypothetical protein [Nocardia yamanashiensis]